MFDDISAVEEARDFTNSSANPGTRCTSGNTPWRDDASAGSVWSLVVVKVGGGKKTAVREMAGSVPFEPKCLGVGFRLYLYRDARLPLSV